MKPQPITIEWPQEKLLAGLSLIIDEQAFSPLRKRIMKTKFTKLARRGLLEVRNLDTEWLYRLCAASLMEHDYHWFAWEWRSQWASELATKIWAYPRWDGAQQRILVVAEQGIGDEIVFSSCYNDLAADVEEAWIEVSPRLIPIFERSFPKNLHFVSRFVNDAKMVVPRMNDYPKFHESLPIEAFIMAGNVPKLYRRDVKDFPNRAGFLVADFDKASYWTDHAQYVGWPMCGCSWKGRQGEIEPVAQSVSLQYGVDDHRGLIVPRIDLKWNFEEVFALIAALGRVVTTTNAVAHMAGALGVETDVIQPKPIYATKEDSFNNRCKPWWPYDMVDWYPSITMYRNQREWQAIR